MKRFVEGQDRGQLILLPECLDDYVGENNPVRVVDAFIEELDLALLDFAGVVPEATGRPSYHPATLLKIYLYGYLNQVQSSRRLEREAQRNIELMWLVGRLAPDFKTIADFRKDNGAAIRAVCRSLWALPSARLFTRRRCCDRRQQVQSGEQPRQELHRRQGHRADGAGQRQHRALPGALDRADREEGDVAEAKSVRLKEKIAGLRRQMHALKMMEQAVQDAPDQQVSLTDPDARSMATSGKGTATVGYNVQIAVDAEHHLIVAHEVINQGYDRHQLAPMAFKAQQATGCEQITALADRGYFNGDQVFACETPACRPVCQRPLTSGNAKRGLFTGQDFIYDAEKDHYTCPAGEHLTRGLVRSDRSGDIDQYRHLTACFTCPLKLRCTAEKVKRVKRWKHEGVLDAMQARLDRMPDAMGVRRQTVEHPFGTIKSWMGSTHFLTRTLKRVRTEMSLHVLAYNIKRVMRSSVSDRCCTRSGPECLDHRGAPP